MILYSDSLGPSVLLSGYIISTANAVLMANAILQHLTHVTND